MSAKPNKKSSKTKLAAVPKEVEIEESETAVFKESRKGAPKKTAGKVSNYRVYLNQELDDFIKAQAIETGYSKAALLEKFAEEAMRRHKKLGGKDKFSAFMSYLAKTQASNPALTPLILALETFEHWYQNKARKEEKKLAKHAEH